MRAKCCVPDCPTGYEARAHSFPKNESLGRLWLNLVQNQLLCKYSYEDVKKKFLICPEHFLPSSYLEFGHRRKLKENAVPTLGLSKQSVADIASEDFTEQYEDSAKKLYEKNPDRILDNEISIFKPNDNFLYTVEDNDSTETILPDMHLAFSPSVLSLSDCFPGTFSPQSVRRSISMSTPKRRIELNVEESNPKKKLRVEQDLVEELGTIEHTEFTDSQNKTPTRNEKAKRKRAFLGKKKNEQLSPKAEEIHKIAQNIQKRHLKTKAQLKRCRKRLFEESKKLPSCAKDLSSTQMQFIQMHLDNAGKPEKSRRYTEEQKTLCAAILKISKKCYNILRSFFLMPSIRTIRRHLRKVKLQPGINPCIYSHLKNTAENMPNHQVKVIFTMWDEFAVRPHVSYDPKRDFIIGFEDFGDKRTSYFADHLLVFMVRGVKTGAKMPVSYYFVNACTTWEQLTKCIKDNVRAIKKTGLQLVLTVCDQGTSNVKALKELRQQYVIACEEKGTDPGHPVEIEIEGVSLLVMFDPPHVAKSDRNNFVNKNIEMDFSNQKKNRKKRKIASWDHIEMAFDMDQNSDSLERSLPKLTEEHIRPNKLKKMKVSYSLNVLSESMNRFITTSLLKNVCVKTSNGSLKLPKEAQHTAEYVLFRDKLFDSVNGQCEGTADKPLRRVLKDDSSHISFWQEAKTKLKNIKYVRKDTLKPKKNPPSLEAWPNILEALERLWKRLKEIGFPFLKLGLLNQDALENFFGCMRSHSRRFVKLNCIQAEGVFKTLLINNLVSYHAVGFNCMPDYGEGLFALQSLIQECSNQEFENFVNIGENDEKRHPPLTSASGRKRGCFRFEIRQHLAQVFAKQLLSKYRSYDCQNCREAFFKVSENPDDQINLQDGSMKLFESCYLQATNTCFQELPVMCFLRDVGLKLVTLLSQKINFNWVACVEHRDLLKNQFCWLITIHCINKWCSHLNRLLNGSLMVHGNSIIEQRAREHFVKYRTRTRGTNKQRGYVV